MSERLAIDGGAPVRASMLPYGRQEVDDDDIAAVVATLKGDWLTTGPAVDELEAGLANYVGAAHAVAVSSGTAALHAACFAAGVGPGDEVIVPALTFAADANCARYLGATPVFADIRPDTMNLDPGAAAEVVTDRTRAIVAVDYAGLPADLAEIGALAEAAGAVVVEDACHALGATYRGEKVGSLSPFSTFSFHPVKHVTTGEGGAVTTDDEAAAVTMRRFRNHGITTGHRERTARNDWSYDMVDLGYNYRLSDVSCALGLSQLRRADRWLERRREIARRYRDAMASFEWLVLPADPDDRESAWHLFVVQLVLERLRADRAEVFRALRAEGIGVNVHYVPVYWHPYYQAMGYRRGMCPVTEAVYERILTLPMFPAMTDRDVDDVVRAVRKVGDALGA